jgi:hypothetical protein
MPRPLKPGSKKADVLSFAARKSVPIEPELKAFLDECVIPLLIREALAEFSKKTLETQPKTGADCDRMSDVANPVETVR